jgi:hypothetical protein
MPTNSNSYRHINMKCESSWKGMKSIETTGGIRPGDRWKKRISTSKKT